MKGGNIELPKGHYTLTFILADGTPADLNFEPNDVHGDCESILVGIRRLPKELDESSRIFWAPG